MLREEGLTALAQAIASHGNNGPVIGNRFVPRHSQLGLDFDDHLRVVIAAMQGAKLAL